MSSRTLTRLIQDVIGGQSEVEEDTLEVSSTPSTPTTSTETLDTSQVEKIAAVLEAISLKGLENILEKQAAAKAPPGTNESTQLSGTSGTQHTSTKSAPPMKSAPTGKVEDNSKTRPGGTSSVDTSSKQKGTHHSALASNEAAINASPTIKEKEVAPALSAVLRNAGGDANHRKMQKVAGHDPEAIRAEIAKRLAAMESTNA